MAQITDNQIKESQIVKGICQSIVQMNLPSFIHLGEMLKKWGWTLTKN